MHTRKVKGLGLTYYLWGDDPVHALGEVRGNEFQFIATAGKWEINVTEYGKVWPARNGDAAESGPMPHTEAASIVEAFIRDYAAVD